MPNPIYIFLGILIIDFVLKMRKEKQDQEIKYEEESTRETDTNKKSSFEVFMQTIKDGMDIEFEDKQTKIDKVESSEIAEVSREGVGSQKRADRIENQRAKEFKHSDFEKQQRLKRDQIVKESRLSEQKGSQDFNNSRQNNDYDSLDTVRPVSIEAVDTSLQSSKSKKLDLLNIKEDILKGVIYSEILGKPKSLQDK